MYKIQNKSGLDLLHGDCLTLLNAVPDSSIDMVLADLPYGTTACKWDSIIDLNTLWQQYTRVCKPESAIVLTASQPFTTKLISSNLEMFKYTWVWEKEQGSMPMQAPYQPIKVHEDIVVFSKKACSYSKKGSMSYYPQKVPGKPYKANQDKVGNITFHSDPSGDHFKDNTGDRYPRSVVSFKTERGLHPTQKPVALMEYLVKTYTVPGQVVLDNCMGSGTTGVACARLGRGFIGIEKDDRFFVLAKERVEREYLTNSQSV